MAHRHYFGFVLDEDTLRRHAVHDHGQDEAAVEKIEDITVWHDHQHPEITTEPSTTAPTIEDLAQQLIAMQSAVDDLVLTSLLG